MHEFDTKNYPSKDKIIMKETKFIISLFYLELEILLKSMLQKSHFLLAHLPSNFTDKQLQKKRAKNHNNLSLLWI